MVGQGKRVESGGGSQGAGQVGGACQPCTLPQCGVRACRSNSSSGGNRGPGVKKFVRIWETRERPSSPPSWSTREIREARFWGRGGGRPLPGKHCPFCGGPWESRERSWEGRPWLWSPPGHRDSATGPPDPVERSYQYPRKMLSGLHVAPARSRGCLTLQDPALPQSSNAGAPAGAPGHLHAFFPSPQKSEVSRI